MIEFFGKLKNSREEYIRLDVLNYLGGPARALPPLAPLFPPLINRRHLVEFILI